MDMLISRTEARIADVEAGSAEPDDFLVSGARPLVERLAAEHMILIIASGTNRYPDLGAWISVGGWPVFTRNALASVSSQTKVISFDTIPPAPDLLKDGKVQVLIGQKYFGWGSESVRLLADIKAGKMPSAPILDSGVDVVTAANVDDYVKSWNQLERQ